MKLTCPSCGRRYDVVDEPASGRASSLRCTCGNGMIATGAAPAAHPEAGPRYDAHAARHGLLIDEAEARALAAGGPVLEPAVDAAPWGDFEVTLNFSTALPLAVPEKQKAPARGEAAAPPIAPPAAASPPAPAAIPPAWIVPAAALIAFLAVGGGTASILLPGATLAAALSTITAPLRGASHEAPAPFPPAAEPAPARQAAQVEQTDPDASTARPRDGDARVRTKVAVGQRPLGRR